MGRTILWGRWGFLALCGAALLATSGCGPGFGGLPSNGGSGGGTISTGPVPTIDTVGPTPFAGPIAGGTVLTLSGQNLKGATVTVGSAACGSVNVNTAGTTVTCVAPAGTAGNAAVVLRTQRGSAQATFLYQSAPTLSTVFPIPFAGPTSGSTLITLGGTNLQNGAVTLGGTACTSTSVNAAGTSISCVTPARPAGTATVQVITPGGTANGGTSFLYQSAPTVTSTLPTPFAGPIAGGTAVTLVGTGLTNAQQVTFGGTACTSLVVGGGGTSLTCNTPAHAAGNTAVVVRTPGGSTTVSSTYLYEGAPTVTGASPRGGPIAGGTTITLTGTNFLSATAVTVGGTACTSFTAVSSTSLTCVTPAGSAGPVNVVVTNPTSTGTLANGFTYEGTPTVTSVSPAYGAAAGGTSVAINGTGLLSVTGITFGGSACTAITPVSTTTATCTTPAHAPGAVDVIATNPTGSNTLVGGFFYEGTPTVTGVSPSAGGIAGGTTITITGTSFRTTTGITVGGTACTSFAVQSSTQATCVTPARSAGTVSVAVTNPSGTGTLGGSFTYESAPTLTVVTPNGGPTAGNTLITLTGTQLRTISAVTVGGAACSQVTPVGPTSATCRTPAGAAGLVAVGVTNATSTATLNNAFRYESAPTIATITPSAGPIAGGTGITINGTMFTTATGVTVGGSACGSFTVVSATQITCVTPAGAQGAADVVVTNLTGSTTSVGGFQYEGAPTVTAVSPNSGSVNGGQTITVTGTNLRTTTDVQLGGVSCTSITPAASGTTLTCVTGPNGPGTVDVVVFNPTASATLSSSYFYEDLPTISTVTPSVGPTIGGTSIALVGTGFRSTTGVTVNGSPCTPFVASSGTNLTCTTPASGAGAVDVTVTNSTGPGTKVNGFTYVGAPTVTSFLPVAGPIAGNTLVTLSGTNFQIATGATFNGVACTSFTVVNATTITCRTPAASAGNATIIVTSGSGSAAAQNSFVYEDTPTISTVSPAAGTTSGNTIITVTGTNFLTTTGVTVGGSVCTSLAIFSPTQITCHTPLHAAGAVDVVLTNSTGSDTKVGGYTYEAAPTVTNVSPSIGSSLGGTAVTVTGTNFLSLTNLTFAGASCTSLSVVSATQATCVTPARPAGAATVSAINGAGSGNLPSGFTYEGAPTLTSVTPVAGGTAGGTNISLVGTNLGTTTGVTVGGSNCTGLVIVTPTNVTCNTPAGAVGTVAVSVTNGTGVATLNSGFTYESAPTVTNVSPAFGASAGGTVITITGTKFLSTTGITVGGTACATFSVTSATTATCTVPAGAGTVAVAVTNAAGSGSLPAAFSYVGAPTVSAISPTAGTTSGGQTVTLTGTNFQTVTGVTIGGSNCTGITVLSATTLTCTTPIGVNGAATVTAINGSGTGSLPGGFTYESAPALTLVAPASGPPTGGTSITLTGQRFLSTTAVTVGGNPCTSYVVNSATSITCTTPPGAPGAQAVAVTNTAGSASLPAAFVYDNAPTIASVSPAAGKTAGGTTITLTGTGFSSATGATVGGTACGSFTVLTATTATCVTPAKAAGSYTVAVTNAAGTGSLTNGYTYEGNPTIASIAPAAGTTAGNTTVTITGTNFLSASGVTIGGLNCTTLSISSATSLTCKTPANAAGAYDVVVTNGSGSATLVAGYTYEGAPTVAGVVPGAGTTAGNTLVTVTGTGFLSATAVTFGGTACTSITIVDGTTLTCRTPAKAAGASTVAVTNPAGSGNLPSAYFYEGNPTISSIASNSGSQAGGQTVTITGTNYRSAVSVTIGGNPCGSLTVLSATQVTCVTPSGPPGAANVVITNGTNSATLTNGFTYEGAPTLTAVAPAAGPVAGGTLITLTGTSFKSVTGVTVGGAACTGLTLVNATTVRCNTPAGTGGVVSVVVTNAFSSATLSNSFTYDDTPTLTAVSPVAGRLAAGGATVTLTGTGFLTATSVTIGGGNCTAFSSVTDTSLTCTKPAGVAGAADVVVTNPTGSATLVGGYTFEANPTLTAVSPGSGPIDGGTTITLTGTNFLSATTVDISGTACGSVTVVSATQVTCVTGARAAGLGNVRIFNTNGNATLAGSFRYEGNPTLTSVAPTAGTTAGGDTLTLTGTNFLTATAVTVAGVACTPLNIISTTSLSCPTPAHAAGAATVVVTNPSGSAQLTNAFTFEAAPTLASISPAAGTTAGNTLVTLTGTNYLSATGVTIGGLACTSFTKVSSTQVTCRTPANAVGSQDVVVTTLNSTATLVNGYTYETTPTVTGVSPGAGTITGNTLVTITGTGFLSATSVNFSGTTCGTLTIVDATTITCRTGARGAATVNVSVVNPVGTGTLNAAYVYEGNPTITSVSPSAGSIAGGTTVTINGTGFLSAASVVMTTTTCGTLTVVSATQLTCVTGARGASVTNVIVTNSNGSATSVGGYTYEGAPTITAVSPAAGTTAGNTTITLTGTNFLSTTGITVDGNPCGTIVIASKTSLTCKTPAGAAGPVDVVLTNDNSSVTKVNGFTYEATPTVTSVSPSAGSTLGNTLVTVTGTGFLSATAVTIGAACSSITVVSATTITCRTGARGAGAVSASVTNPAGVGTLASPAYTYEAVPTITSIVPSSGTTAGGTTVTINGTGFLSATAVSFGGTACGTITIVSGSQLTCVTGARGASSVAVTVTNNAGSVSTAAGGYTYEAAPTVTAISPLAGASAGNTTITLTGTGLLSTTGVTVGGAACGTLTIVSNTTVTCKTPPGTAGPVDVVLTNATSSVTKTNFFTYDDIATVSLQSVVYGTTAGNTLITFTGTGFLSVTNITFGGTACTSIVLTSDTSMNCRTPARAAGAVTIAIINPSGTLSLPAAYTYEDAPTFTAISPAAGAAAGGTTVTLTGTRFLSVSSVTFGGTACTSLSVVNATTLTCVTPAKAAGQYTVVVNNVSGSATRVNAYTYDNAPTLTSVSPAAGRLAGGRTITLTGTQFSSATGATFGGVACTSFTVTSTTTATCVTPATAAGAVDVVITNAVSSATLVGGYTFEASPTVTAVVPTGGPTTGGQTITITGTSFLSTASVNLSGTACTNVQVVNATTVTCRTGARAAATVNVSVVNDNGTGTLNSAYVYRAAPTVTSVSPNMGVIAGGTSVTITGTGFLTGAIATFSGVSCSALTVVNATTITCTTGSSASMQRGNVVVTNNDNQSGTLTSGWLYVGANTWLANSTTGAPLARRQHTAVWTGSKMLVWGGTDSTLAVTNTGGSYDPVTDAWTAISTGANVPTARTNHQAVYVGSRMVVFGGYDGTVELGDGARYDPATDTWATMSAASIPSARQSFTAVSNGTVMVVWGGVAGGVPTNTGGRYNPSTDVWTATSTASAPAARSLHTAVYSGSLMIVWGGIDGSSTLLNSGSRYDPTGDTWSATGGTPPSARDLHTAVWSTSNSKMVVWGGYDGTSYVNTGSQYDPTGNTWTATSVAGSVPSARAYHSAVFTGTKMIIFGGDDNTLTPVNTGGQYTTASNSWSATSVTGAVPSARSMHTAVFTNLVMTVFGGRTGSANGVNDGGIFAP